MPRLCCAKVNSSASQKLEELPDGIISDDIFDFGAGATVDIGQGPQEARTYGLGGDIV